MMKVLVTKSLNKATKLSLPESINGLAWDCTPTCCVIRLAQDMEHVHVHSFSSSQNAFNC